MRNKYIYIFLIVSLLSITCSAQPKIRSISDGRKSIYYTDISDAERQISEYYKERQRYEISDENVYDMFNPYFPYKMFISLVSKDERTIQHSFSFEHINQILSPDSKVKLYNWCYGVGATDGAGMDGILTYQTSDKYMYSVSKEGFEGLRELIVPTDTYKIETVTTTEGYPVYLFFASNRTMSSYTYWVSSYIISNQALEKYHAFFTNGQLSSVYRKSIGTGGEYSGDIKFQSGSLYIPQEGFQTEFWSGWSAPISSGYIDVFFFFFNRFTYKETIYDNTVPLNNKLRDFKSTVVTLDFKPWKIRIDQMPNGSFRYSSWKNNEISATPNIVISNGKRSSTQIKKGWHAEEIKFIFKNYSYEYIVTYEHIQYNRFDVINPTRLCIYQNGKILIDIVPKEN